MMRICFQVVFYLPDIVRNGTLPLLNPQVFCCVYLQHLGWPPHLRVAVQYLHFLYIQCGVMVSVHLHFPCLCCCNSTTEQSTLVKSKFSHCTTAKSSVELWTANPKVMCSIPGLSDYVVCGKNALYCFKWRSGGLLAMNGLLPFPTSKKMVKTTGHCYITECF